MKELENDIIKKYSYEDYVVYIKDYEEYESSWECYLQKESIGIMYFMFGLLKEYNDLETVKQTIKDNIKDYIVDYKEEFED